MGEYFADLHIHSCLSPCASDDMTPANIVGMAKISGLDVIALTDHNSCKNCVAAVSCGEEAGVLVIPGMELTTAEEAHIICLFPDIERAMLFDADVEGRLLKINNNVKIFGNQLVMDEAENITGEYPYLLTNATDIGVYEVVELTGTYGGIAYPAHIDRSSMSVLASLGFITDDMRFNLVEFSKKGVAEGAPEEKKLFYGGLPYLCASDAHYLEDIFEGQVSVFLEELSRKEVLNRLLSLDKNINIRW